MKRELKFKSFVQNIETGERFWIFYGIGDKPNLLGHKILVEDLQFTGRYDVNGKEVYEQDLIKGDGDGPHPIWWDKRKGYFSCCCYKDDDNIFTYKKIEITGTVAETTEFS